MAEPAGLNLRAVWNRLWSSWHEGWFRATDGQILNHILGMPVVMLTTTGRHTGERRNVMLTSPVQDGPRLVLVASNGGAGAHPAWFYNVQAEPVIEVTTQGGRRPMRASVASAEERAELWPRVVAAYAGYGEYQRRTSREIPLVILDPIDG